MLCCISGKFLASFFISSSLFFCKILHIFLRILCDHCPGRSCADYRSPPFPIRDAHKVNTGKSVLVFLWLINRHEEAVSWQWCLTECHCLFFLFTNSVREFFLHCEVLPRYPSPGTWSVHQKTIAVPDTSSYCRTVSELHANNVPDTLPNYPLCIFIQSLSVSSALRDVIHPITNSSSVSWFPRPSPERSMAVEIFRFPSWVYHSSSTGCFFWFSS